MVLNVIYHHVVQDKSAQSSIFKVSTPIPALFLVFNGVSIGVKRGSCCYASLEIKTKTTEAVAIRVVFSFLVC